MPPSKPVIKKSAVPAGNENSVVKSVSTRSSKVASTLKKENSKDTGLFSKRKAASPIKGNTLKRSALGNITNAIETKCVINSGKKPLKKPVTVTVNKPVLSTATKSSLSISSVTRSSTAASAKPPSPPKSNALKSTLPPLPKSRLTLPIKASTTNLPRPSIPVSNLKTVAPTNIQVKSVPEKPVQNVTKLSPTAGKKTTVQASKCRGFVAKPKGTAHKDPLPHVRRSSRRSTLESTDSSLYQSALSDVLDIDVTSSDVASPEKKPVELPAPLVNIDDEYKEDPFQCATYAQDIFQYLKTREKHFKINEYMDMQDELSSHYRAVLVDWMVEVQENFEMNHETLYLAVKLVDAYLSKIRVAKTCLQLVGTTALLIAAKYDERIPPAIDDFLYICDGSYMRKDVLKMEVNILKVIDFELGFPLSYRFLRRYARCAKIQMPLLTLARFILEYTLMDYSLITISDSKMAAAALYLAFKMKKEQEWDETLIHFTGYKVEDFIDVAYKLNNSLHQKPRNSLSTVRTKYSHRIFFEVAKTSLTSNDNL